MPKRFKSRKIKKSSSLKKYFLSLVVALVIIVVGNYFLKSQPTCANSHSCTSDLSLKVENEAIGTFQGHKVIPPKIDLAIGEKNSSVLGANVPSADKHIYVDLSSQTLYAYQGDTKIMQTFISSGRWGKTPTGNFNIWEKLRSTRMSGGQGDDFYDLPNVPFVMYFFHDFGLHGAYWHDNFGHTMSHGCVNMRQIDAEALFNWADGPENKKLGTAVSVCDSFTAPGTCIQNDPIN